MEINLIAPPEVLIENSSWLLVMDFSLQFLKKLEISSSSIKFHKDSCAFSISSG